MSNGFLTLLQRHLKQAFSRDKNLKAKDWQFVIAGSKIFVHGPNRTPTNPETLLEVTTDSQSVTLKLMSMGTIPDREILAKIIDAWAPNTKINFESEKV